MFRRTQYATLREAVGQYFNAVGRCVFLDSCDWCCHLWCRLLLAVVVASLAVVVVVVL